MDFWQVILPHIVSVVLGALSAFGVLAGINRQRKKDRQDQDQAKRDSLRDEMDQVVHNLKDLEHARSEDAEKYRQMYEDERAARMNLESELHTLKLRQNESEVKLQKMDELQRKVDRLQASQALFLDKHSEQFIFTENPVAAMAFVDHTGHIVKANGLLARQLGYTPDELEGVHFGKVTAREDVPDDVDYFGELIARDRDHYDMIKTYLMKDGGKRTGHLYVWYLPGKEFVLGLIDFNIEAE